MNAWLPGLARLAQPQLQREAERLLRLQQQLLQYLGRLSECSERDSSSRGGSGATADGGAPAAQAALGFELQVGPSTIPGAGVDCVEHNLACWSRVSTSAPLLPALQVPPGRLRRRARLATAGQVPTCLLAHHQLCRIPLVQASSLDSNQPPSSPTPTHLQPQAGACS